MAAMHAPDPMLMNPNPRVVNKFGLDPIIDASHKLKIRIPKTTAFRIVETLEFEITNLMEGKYEDDLRNNYAVMFNIQLNRMNVVEIQANFGSALVNTANLESIPMTDQKHVDPLNQPNVTLNRAICYTHLCEYTKAKHEFDKLNMVDDFKVKRYYALMLMKKDGIFSGAEQYFNLIFDHNAKTPIVITTTLANSDLGSVYVMKSKSEGGTEMFLKGVGWYMQAIKCIPYEKIPATHVPLIFDVLFDTFNALGLAFLEARNGGYFALYMFQKNIDWVLPNMSSSVESSFSAETCRNIGAAYDKLSYELPDLEMLHDRAIWWTNKALEIQKALSLDEQARVTKRSLEIIGEARMGDNTTIEIPTKIFDDLDETCNGIYLMDGAYGSESKDAFDKFFKYTGAPMDIKSMDMLLPKNRVM